MSPYIKSDQRERSKRLKEAFDISANEVSPYIKSDQRELLLQVRTNEVSEHMLQKRPKGAPSDRSSERSERQRERQATEGSGER